MTEFCSCNTPSYPPTPAYPWPVTTKFENGRSHACRIWLAYGDSKAHRWEKPTNMSGTCNNRENITVTFHKVSMLNGSHYNRVINHCVLTSSMGESNSLVCIAHGVLYDMNGIGGWATPTAHTETLYAWHIRTRVVLSLHVHSNNFSATKTLQRVWANTS